MSVDEMNRIKTIEYAHNQKREWDKFVTNSKNGTFLFYRDYMEYHSERFTDHSLMFYEEHNLIAVMPANVKNETLFSHGGLTFGGIVYNQKMKTSQMLDLFESMKEYLRKLGIRQIVYKALPHIYHKIPSEEDLYALFLNDARLVRRDVASAIFMENKLNFAKDKRQFIKKAKIDGLEVIRSYDFKEYMSIKEADLDKKYGVKPTHTPEEIDLLASRFPENIKLFSVYVNKSMVAGVIVYEYDTVAHAQYLASTEKGKELHAADSIFGFLINDYYSGKKYFDFGIATEKEGKYLNKGLIDYKERFGGRAIVYDHYIIDV
jgi:hypothetical protein